MKASVYDDFRVTLSPAISSRCAGSRFSRAPAGSGNGLRKARRGWWRSGAAEGTAVARPGRPPDSQTMISCLGPISLYPRSRQSAENSADLKQHYPALHPRSLRSPIARRHARGQVVIGAMPMGFESKVDAERCVSLGRGWPALGLTLYDGNTRLIHLACSRAPGSGAEATVRLSRLQAKDTAACSRAMSAAFAPSSLVMWKGQAGYAPHNPVGQDSTVDGETFAKPHP